MDFGSIIEWAKRLEPASDTESPILLKPSPPKNARKRKAESSYSLASPPSSYTKGVNNNNMSTSSQKKRRLGSQGGLVDPDATPRPESHSFPSSVASMSASEASSLSRQSSVKGQIMSLRLGDAGVEYETLNDNSVPEAAKTLFATMTEIERGLYILPDAMRDTIKKDQGFADADFKRSQWKFCFKSADEPDNLPGRIPPPAQMKNILAMATECDRYRHEELSWNAMVQLPLLRLIFQNELGKQYDDFNAML
ncbi:hypothetical protein ACHAPX_001089, partial [Trichoderma viride]